jgi:NTE family protein
MGADFIIAVDLNNDIITRNGREKRFQVLKNSSKNRKNRDRTITDSSLLERASESQWFPPKLEQTYRSFEYSLKQSVNSLFEVSDEEQQWEPNIFDVIANSINIMEYQITRSKLMEDQPDILVQPQLGHLNLFDFDEAERTIKEGYKVTNDQLEKLNRLTTSISDD